VSVVAEVIVPTFRHSGLLPFCIESIQRQTVADIRIHIVGDGTDDATRDVVRSLQESDQRIIFYDHPKSERTGEQYRHPIVMQSPAAFVTYLGDDDLMSPDHIELMAKEMVSSDVSFPPLTFVDPNGMIELRTHSLDDPYWRTIAINGMSLFSLSGLTHTTAAYRSLAEGWTTTPREYFTDQYMILKFLTRQECRFSLASLPTVLHFPSSQRNEFSPLDRVAEIEKYSRQFASLEQWNEFRLGLLDNLRRRENEAQVSLLQLRDDHERASQLLVNQQHEIKRLQQNLNDVELARVIRLRNFLLRSRFVRAVLRLKT